MHLQKDFLGRFFRGPQKSAEFRLLLIRMFNTTFVGTGVLDCPQQKNFGRELVFSADLRYNEVSEKPPSRREPWGFVQP